MNDLTWWRGLDDPQMNKRQQGFTTESHFEGKEPLVREIYNRLMQDLRKLGPVVEDPKKTSIHINHRTALAGVATRKSHLVLTIKSDRKLNSPRIHKSQKTSASRFHHEVKLTSVADVDAELVSWLKDAYALSA
jgi:hypothetical protein